MVRPGQSTGGQMQQNVSPGGERNERAAPRTNLFMAATVHAADGAHAVKIRDLSAVGAQIETSLSPEVGSAMTLARGRLSVECHVTWVKERRCGLHFSARVSVPDWMANPVNLEQKRVDQPLAAVKTGDGPFAAPGRQPAKTAQQISEDLKGVALLLEMLGDALAGDPAMITRHGIPLQNLAIAVQTLTVLADSANADAPAQAGSIARLAELRASCAQALQARTQSPTIF